MDKKVLRKEIRQELKGLDIDKKVLLDQAIYNNFITLNLDYKNICLYNHLPSEVETYHIFRDLVKRSNIYMPVVVGDDIELVKVDENTKYETGAYNIMEPVGERIKAEDVKIDLCITPMLGADRRRNRLGKGKGYYDRFFSKVDCFKVGLCYDFALVDEIECESHDIKMDIIVTDREIIR